jgi:hypothetical protein
VVCFSVFHVGLQRWQSSRSRGVKRGGSLKFIVAILYEGENYTKSWNTCNCPQMDFEPKTQVVELKLEAMRLLMEDCIFFIDVFFRESMQVRIHTACGHKSTSVHNKM